MTEELPILSACGIAKQYGGTFALNGVDFDLYPGAVNVLIGENGAGKSTLMRILAGVEAPQAGTITLHGKAVQLRSPQDASAHGIAIVHQELSVLPNLDVSDNIFAGRELTRGIVVDRHSEDARSAAALVRLHKQIAVTTPASRLPLGERQIVELARALVHSAQILILDEPTSALSAREAETLFQVVADLKAAGVAIVYISHRLHELLHLGDFFTVLRSGRVVGQASRETVTRQWIVERMSGRADTSDLTERAALNSDPVLDVRSLSLPAESATEVAQVTLHDVTFTLHRGEILGIYGLLGSGRTELMETLAGNRRASGGTILSGDLLTLPKNVAQVRHAGMVLVPEDRQRDALFPELSVRENISVASSSGMVLSRKQIDSRVRALIAELKIAVSDMELPVSVLSGGNQQKVLIARCLMSDPRVLLLDEPTRGVDAGAKAEIYRVLRSLAAKGLSILFSSSEIEETQTLADRALVLCQGRVAADLPRSQMTDEALFTMASPAALSTQRPDLSDSPAGVFA